MPPIIQLEDVSFTYPDERDPNKRVLSGLSLSIEEGSFVAILGHNGSGKSTVSKLLNAIHTPTEGRVLVCGMDTRDEAQLFSIRKSVGMVFQNPDNQIVASVVEEDVAFALENLALPPPEIRRRVDAALKRVGMYDFREQAPHLLSGGQKQRVAIAGVIAMAPRCIVFDESTAMLDPLGRREIMGCALQLQREEGITVIFITHHMDEAAKAERLLVMSEGLVIADDTPRAVFSQPEMLRAHGLEAPETVQLLHALRAEGLPLPQDALSDEDCAQALWALLR